MHIGEHSDNSGISINLCRTTGNAKLLDVIICELERQLKLFKEEYKALWNEDFILREVRIWLFMQRKVMTRLSLLML